MHHLGQILNQPTFSFIPYPLSFNLYPLTFTSHLNMYHILFNEVVVLKKIVNIPFCSPLVVGL